MKKFWKREEFSDLYNELKNGKWRNYLELIPDKNMKQEKIPNPKEFNLISDITDLYYLYTGEAFLSDNTNYAIDTEYLIYFQLKNKLYGYIQAWHDYTGFDCRGGIKIYLSKSKEKIEKYAIPKKYLDKINQELADN